MDSFVRDLRLALRGLGRHRGFAAVAILCVALGIGATTTIFSFVDTLLLRAAPFPEAERVVLVRGHSVREGLDRMPLSGYEYLDLQAGAKSFSKTAAQIGLTMSWTGEGDPSFVHAARVSADLFGLLGVPPELGRTFTPDEDTFGQNRVAILSYPFWQRRFGGDPKVVGKTLQLDGAPFEVVGVMPARFRSLGLQDLWIPIAMNLAALPPRTARGLSVVARLAPGVSFEAAATEMGLVAERFVRTAPEAYPKDGGYRLELTPIREELVGRVRPLFLFLSGAVALLLLIACTNVASLLLARALARDREMALRGALGASRGAVLRQLLVESSVLGLAGGLLGVLFGAWGLHALLAMVPEKTFPLLGRVAFSGRSAAFGLAASLLTGLLFGLAPALRAFRTDVAGILKEGGKGSEGRGRQPLRAGLVIAEVALALAVLVGAFLLGRSLSRLAAIDPGFAARGVLTAPIAAPKQIAGEPMRLAGFYRRLEERLAAIPGTTSVGAISQLPLRGDNVLAAVRSTSGDPTAAPIYAGYRVASPGYFATLGIPLLEGRAFAATDGKEARVAIVDSTLAGTLWPGEKALGKSFYDADLGVAAAVEVVGVVGPVRHDSLRAEPQPTYYVPFSSGAPPLAFIALRTTGDPARLAGPLRAAVAELDPQLPVDDVATLAQRVEDSLVRSRLASTLAGFFGAAALALTLAGVYGLLAFAVASRRREFGIRMALGESRGGIVALVLRRSLSLVGVGVALGLALAFALGKLAAAKIADLIYGVSLLDPLSFALAALALVAAGVLASAIPAIRATRTPPSVALRME